eukprot:COSAG02_NODE_821_length_16794_cov_42.795747_4_plen_83_part_00
MIDEASVEETKDAGLVRCILVWCTRRALVLGTRRVFHLASGKRHTFVSKPDCRVYRLSVDAERKMEPVICGAAERTCSDQPL